MKHTMSVDCRGMSRGSCTLCGCDEYERGQTGRNCAGCHHAPAKHKKAGKPDGKISGPIDAKWIRGPPKVVHHSGAIDAKWIRGPPKVVLDCDAIDAKWIRGPPKIELDSGPPSAQCISPGCSRPKFKELEKEHQFCGKRHAKIYQEVPQGKFDIKCVPQAVSFIFGIN